MILYVDPNVDLGLPFRIVEHADANYNYEILDRIFQRPEPITDVIPRDLRYGEVIAATLLPEFYEWLRDIKGTFSAHNGPRNAQNNIDHVVYCFDNEFDAVHFRLRWG